MRIAVGLSSEPVGVPATLLDVVAAARRAETDGMPAAWTVHFSRGLDALTALGHAAAATSELRLGVGVVPTYPRHPLALAQQAATVQAMAGGRLTLGVGVSHRPVIEGMHGLSYTDPAGHMAEYLQVLRPVLRDGAVRFSGDHYRVDAAITVPGTGPVDVLVGGLSARMVTVAGTHADGIVTWLAGVRTLHDEIVPTLLRAAGSAARRPRVVAALPVAVCADTDAGRAAAADALARYATLPNYQRLLAREGVDGPAGVAVVGDETAVADELRRVADAGVTELWPVEVPVASDPDAAARTRSLLRALAQDAER
jgi:5,10-methylenetetrahydromethanopterin reductase